MAKPEVRATVQLNARLQPMDRGEFEDPLHDALQKAGLGEVTGGGTQMADEPAGIAYCDIELSLADDAQATLNLVVAELERLGAPKGTKLILDGRQIPFGVHEGMAIFLNGVDLPDDVYATCDVNHVTEESERLMAGGGKFLSHWQGSRETGLYFYGPSFEQMKAAVAPLLATYPLCQGARVEQIA